MAFLDTRTTQDPLDFFLEFTHLLRLAGLRVGLTETEDAMLAVRVVPEFKSWRTALKATLIKKKQDEAIFDRIFDLYFGPWGGTNDFMGGGESSYGVVPSLDSEEGDLDAAQQHQQYLDALERASQFISRFVFNPSRADNASNLQTAMLLLSQMVSKKTGTGKSLDEIRIDLEQAFLQSREVDEAEQAVESLAMKVNLEEQDFARMDSSEAQLIEDQIEQLIEVLSSRLRRRLQRRYEGKIDLRRTIRRSIQFGGTPIQLAYKKRKQDKPKLMVLADISSSVEAFARFFLMLTRAFQATPITCRSFVFEDEMLEITSRLEHEMSRFPRAGLAVERVLKRLRLQGWGMRRSSYGTSFRQFRDIASSDINKRTTIVILGDARNNYSPPRGEILEALQQKAERVMWLNPENIGLWNGGDSVMNAYKPYCDHLYECRTLAHLRKIVNELVKLGDHR